MLLNSQVNKNNFFLKLDISQATTENLQFFKFEPIPIDIELERDWFSFHDLKIPSHIWEKFRTQPQKSIFLKDIEV